MITCVYRADARRIRVRTARASVADYSYPTPLKHPRIHRVRRGPPGTFNAHCLRLTDIGSIYS